MHIFDRKGKTLFTKKYIADAKKEVADPTAESEQRKLVFGMLFSLSQIIGSLSPNPKSKLHSIKTGASTLFTYETNSGLRIALYVTAANPATQVANTIQDALEHIYHDIWINCVTRSPLYDPVNPNVSDTNFESTLDGYIKSQPWFRT